MILQLKEGISEINSLCERYQATELKWLGKVFLVNSSSKKEILSSDQDKFEQTWVFENDIQLASRNFHNPTREIKISDLLQLGGNSQNTLMISGPCSVENEEQLMQTAEFLHGLGVKVLRAGCYKPRTSPYTFQGLGRKGLEILAKAREKYGMKIITEAKDGSHIEEVIEYTDIVQIGSKAMYDHAILKACAKTQKPILLKRFFGATLQEFVQSAEFILSAGNPNIILCERGIRTFETKTRFTLDLCGVAFLKEYTNLPIIVDPSHAMGYAYGVSDLSKAAIAMGVDGLLIETHPNPQKALSDASQQLAFDQYKSLYHQVDPIAHAIGRKIC
ncbi:MAG: 3-deoxy-7-phosphoheptulonate synthase [Chitinophagales bacterium]|jgi:3-deoxy-7-phosphoheptulonate synthase|nr:3-deoxy-7-phosphoheptulonate synthase [Chitinophagales bacterium]